MWLLEDIYISKNDFKSITAVEGTYGASRIYLYNNTIYFVVDDGIKKIDENGNISYIYQNNKFDCRYVQLYNDRFYFIEEVTYMDTIIGTDIPKICFDDGLVSININGSGKKQYYYLGVDIGVDSNGVEVELITVKPLLINGGQQFVVNNNEVYAGNMKYCLNIIGYPNYMSINSKYIIGYNNYKYFCNKNDKFYTIGILGIKQLIKEDIEIESVFEFNNCNYAVGKDESIYEVTNNSVNKLGYITGIKNIFLFDNEVYSINPSSYQYKGIVKVNLLGHEIVKTDEEENRININNGLNNNRFTYDNENLYLAYGNNLRVVSNDLNLTEDYDLKYDRSGNIQKYKDKIIYLAREGIVIADNDKSEIINENFDKITQIQVYGDYVYYSEKAVSHIDNVKRVNNIKRININTREIEHLVYNAYKWAENIFQVYKNKIIYVGEDSMLYSYNIESGIAQKSNDAVSSGYTETIKLLKDNNIYFIIKGKLSKIDLDTFEKIDLGNIEEEKIKSLFDFDGQIYGVSTDEKLYKINDKSIIELGYVSSIGNVVSNGEGVYSQYNNTLINVNLKGHITQLIDKKSNIININNNLYDNYDKFTYDNENLYVARNKKLKVINKILNTEEIYNLDNEVKGEIQKYKDKLIYLSDKIIILDEDGEEVLVDEKFINKIQVYGDYVYYSCGSSKNTTIKRVNINTKKIESLIFGAYTGSNNRSFIVYQDKIVYWRDNSIYLYDIKKGVAKSSRYINTGIGLLNLFNDSLYYVVSNPSNGDKVLYSINLNNLNKKEICNFGNINIYSLFEFKDKIYALGDKGKIYNMDNVELNDIGYINADKSVLTDGINLYNVSDSKLNKVNIYISKIGNQRIMGATEKNSILEISVNGRNEKEYAVDENGNFGIKLKGVTRGDRISITRVDEAGNKSEKISIDAIYYKEDFNEDGIIDIEDISVMAINYNKTNESNEWDSILDINNDNIIDIFDLIILAKEL